MNIRTARRDCRESIDGNVSPGASSSVDRLPQEAGILTAMMPSMAASTPAMFMFTTLSPCHGSKICHI